MHNHWKTKILYCLKFTSLHSEVIAILTFLLEKEKRKVNNWRRNCLLSIYASYKTFLFFIKVLFWRPEIKRASELIGSRVANKNFFRGQPNNKYAAKNWKFTIPQFLVTVKWLILKHRMENIIVNFDFKDDFSILPGVIWIDLELDAFFTSSSILQVIYMNACTLRRRLQNIWLRCSATFPRRTLRV